MLHVQVGSDRLADELASIKQHQQRHSALVRVLDAKWLRACSSSRSRVAEDGHLMGPGAFLHPAARDAGAMQSHKEASRGGWDGQSPPPAISLRVCIEHCLIYQRCRYSIDT